MRAMCRLCQIMVAILGVLLVGSGTAEAANPDKKDTKAVKRPAALAAVERLYAKEMDALAQAEKLMVEIVDEKSAVEVARRLTKLFNTLPVPMGGNDKQLESLAKAQNVISLKMEKLRKEPWFLSSGLQDAWGLITVPSFRRRATNYDK